MRGRQYAGNVTLRPTPPPRAPALGTSRPQRPRGPTHPPTAAPSLVRARRPHDSGTRLLVLGMAAIAGVLSADWAWLTPHGHHPAEALFHTARVATTTPSPRHRPYRPCFLWASSGTSPPWPPVMSWHA